MMKPDYSCWALSRLIIPAQNLVGTFQTDHGAQIAQSTVISKKVHILIPEQPWAIQILRYADAGRTFYNRSATDEVLHLDIFHQCGNVDHVSVAAEIRNAVAYYNFAIGQEGASCIVSQDMIDVQTSTGGGRITGRLAFGQKPAVGRAHENHVHVALMLSTIHTACLFYIVMAVEHIILSSGLELRRMESIIHVDTAGNQHLDVSSLVESSDSLLTESNTPDFNGTSSPQRSDKELMNHQELQNHTETTLPDGEMVDEDSAGDIPKNLHCDQQSLIGLNGKDAINGQQRFIRISSGVVTTENSKMLKLEGSIRRVLAKSPSVFGHKSNRMPEHKDRGKGKRTCLHATGKAYSGPLDITATIHNAATRMLTEMHSKFTIGGADLRYWGQYAARKYEICFVIDASASMEGARFQLAKSLALRLLRVTPHRIAIVTFQDEHAHLRVPLTRDVNLLKSAFDGIKPRGATPLALGLKACIDHLTSVRTRNPVVILITDGLPTYASGNLADPVADALGIAKNMKRKGVTFLCIGLTEKEEYLKNLAEAAGGTIYIYGEL